MQEKYYVFENYRNNPDEHNEMLVAKNYLELFLTLEYFPVNSFDSYENFEKYAKNLINKLNKIERSGEIDLSELTNDDKDTFFEILISPDKYTNFNKRFRFNKNEEVVDINFSHCRKWVIDFLEICLINHYASFKNFGNQQNFYELSQQENIDKLFDKDKNFTDPPHQIFIDLVTPNKKLLKEMQDNLGWNKSKILSNLEKLKDKNELDFNQAGRAAQREWSQAVWQQVVNLQQPQIQDPREQERIIRNTELFQRKVDEIIPILKYIDNTKLARGIKKLENGIERISHIVKYFFFFVNILKIFPVILRMSILAIAMPIQSLYNFGKWVKTRNKENFKKIVKPYFILLLPVKHGQFRIKSLFETGIAEVTTLHSILFLVASNRSKYIKNFRYSSLVIKSLLINSLKLFTGQSRSFLRFPVPSIIFLQTAYEVFTFSKIHRASKMRELKVFGISTLLNIPLIAISYYFPVTQAIVLPLNYYGGIFFDIHTLSKFLGGPKNYVNCMKELLTGKIIKPFAFINPFNFVSFSDFFRSIIDPFRFSNRLGSANLIGNIKVFGKSNYFTFAFYAVAPSLIISAIKKVCNKLTGNEEGNNDRESRILNTVSVYYDNLANRENIAYEYLPNNNSLFGLRDARHNNLDLLMPLNVSQIESK
ncbi:MAG: hypothetical protein J0H68_05020 [Sphingobacteriia bacterium]|nr:hypothetical protein [Sphingobacteriia bacterium]